MDINILNNFIEDRIESNYPTLLNNPDYLVASTKFNAEYKELISHLSETDIQALEHIMCIKDDLMSQEIYLSYKVGFSDGFNFKKEIN